LKGSQEFNEQLLVASPCRPPAYIPGIG